MYTLKRPKRAKPSHWWMLDSDKHWCRCRLSGSRLHLCKRLPTVLSPEPSIQPVSERSLGSTAPACAAPLWSVSLVRKPLGPCKTRALPVWPVRKLLWPQGPSLAADFPDATAVAGYGMRSSLYPTLLSLKEASSEPQAVRRSLSGTSVAAPITSMPAQKLTSATSSRLIIGRIKL